LQTNPHKLPTQCEKELQFYYIHELGGRERERGCELYFEVFPTEEAAI
jgi:hypothetical protein